MLFRSIPALLITTVAGYGQGQAPPNRALALVGGVVYALKRPNPSPTWFGFHEVFHALTLLGFLTQYVAVSLVLYGAR